MQRAFYIRSKYKEYLNGKYWYGMHSRPCHTITHIDWWWALWMMHLPYCCSLAYSENPKKIFEQQIVECGCVRERTFFCYGNKRIYFVPSNAQPECSGRRKTEMKNKSKSKTKSKSNYPHKKLCGRLHSEAVNSDEEKCVSRAKMQMRMQTTQRQHGKKKLNKKHAQVILKWNTWTSKVLVLRCERD